MKTKLKKYITGSVLTMALFSGAFSVAHAETFLVNFDKIVVTDDGDVKPDGAGEITFTFSANGKRAFKKYMKVSDKGNRVRHLNFSKKVHVPSGGRLTVIAHGNEYDRWSRNETCSGKKSTRPYSNQSMTLRCSGGGMSYILHYHLDRH